MCPRPTATLRASVADTTAERRRARPMLTVVHETSLQAVGDPWLAGLDQLHARIAPRFGRAEVRARARRYVLGLLSAVERKNGWQLARQLHEPGPQGVQRLLNAAAWNAELVRDDLRAYVVEHFGAPDGILIVDETGFLKKGTTSAGVARQSCGLAGRRENQQIGVFLAYAASQGCAFIDRALYIPEEWAVNRARRTAAGIPPTVQFATQGGLAQAMLARAFAADLPMKWVVGAPLAGQATLRAWLDQRACNYVLGVPATQRVWTQGRQVEAQWLMEQLSPRAWTRWQRATGATDRRRTSGPGGPFPPRNRPGGGSGCSSGARCGSGPRAPT
ncbi:MAG: hypothetical protein CYG59_23760, partial [Chloroflexi bacterium]